MPTSINLVKKEVPFLDKFIAWALTIGRLLVVITELIALSAFIYRFSLDRQLIDLHSKIKQQEAIVNHFKSNEDAYRNLQERLALSKTFSKLSDNIGQTFKDVTGFAPKDILFSNLSFHRNRITINANAYSTSSLSSFINSLKNYRKIQTVSVDSIENKISSGFIIVSITAFLKEK